MMFPLDFPPESYIHLSNAYVMGSWCEIIEAHRSVHSKSDGDSSPHDDDLRFVDLLYSLLPSSLLRKEWCPPAFVECASDCEAEFRFCAAQLHSALLALSSQAFKASVKHVELFCLYFADFLAKYFPSSGSSLLFRRFDASPCLCDCLKKFYLTSKLSASGLLPTRMTVVLGMHRSGTSALSGMLAQAGLNAPNDALGATDNNKRGYWESESLVTLSDQFLLSENSHWSQLHEWSATWCAGSQAQSWSEAYLQQMSRVFDCSQHVLLKDPRLCILFESLGSYLVQPFIQVDFLLMIRSPVEVVASLVKAEGIAIKTALDLWIGSVLRSECMSRQHPRRLVHYDQLIRDPVSVLESCCSMWGLSHSEMNSSSALGFIDPSLQNQKKNDSRRQILEISPGLESRLDMADELYQASMLSSAEMAHRFDQLKRLWLAF